MQISVLPKSICLFLVLTIALKLYYFAFSEGKVHRYSILDDRFSSLKLSLSFSSGLSPNWCPFPTSLQIFPLACWLLKGNLCMHISFWDLSRAMYIHRHKQHPRSHAPAPSSSWQFDQWQKKPIALLPSFTTQKFREQQGLSQALQWWLFKVLKTVGQNESQVTNIYKIRHQQ